MRNSAADIEVRRAKAFSAFWEMQALWDNNIVPLHLKLKIFKVSVLTVFLYGCETWILTNQEEQRINAFATTCYRHILHIDQEQDRVTNVDLYTMVNAQELVVEVHKRQLRKLGHFLRKPSTALTNKYALYEPSHGTRRPGRPKQSYKDYIAKVINFQDPPTEQSIRQTAMDRKAWAKIVKNQDNK